MNADQIKGLKELRELHDKQRSVAAINFECQTAKGNTFSAAKFNNTMCQHQRAIEILDKVIPK